MSPKFRIDKALILSLMVLLILPKIGLPQQIGEKRILKVLTLEKDTSFVKVNINRDGEIKSLKQHYEVEKDGVIYVVEEAYKKDRLSLSIPLMKGKRKKPLRLLTIQMGNSNIWLK